MCLGSVHINSSWPLLGLLTLLASLNTDLSISIFISIWIHTYIYIITSVVSNSVRPHRWQSTRLLCPWDSPGKNTGVGCHFLLQCMKVKSESEVAQSCLTLSDPMDCSLLGSSVHGIFQARVLEWIAIALSKYIYVYIYFLNSGKVTFQKDLQILRYSQWCDHLTRARHPGTCSQVDLRKHHYEQS